MADGNADGELFDALTRRQAVLERLCERSAHKRDLVAELDGSRSTLDRAVRELETAGLVERGDDGIAATLAGRLAADRLDDFRDELADLADARAVLRPLSADAPLAPEAVAGGEALLAGDPAPFRALERVHDELADAARYRAVLPALDDGRHVRLLYEHVVTGGRPAELVVTPGLFRTLRDEFPRQLAAMADQDGFRLLVTDDPPPFAVGLVDGDGGAEDAGTEDGETDVEDGGADAEGGTADGAGADATDGAGADATVTVVVFTDSGAVHGTLVNGTDRAVRWAERLYADAREGATDRTADLATDVDPGPDAGGADPDGGVHRSDVHPDRPALGRTLPVSLERAGFVRFDAGFVRDEPVADPTTAWRAGLSLPEVHTGYAVERIAEDGEPVADALLDDLRDGGDRVVVGPPGSGKSTTCKRVACAWYDRDEGPVLYREGGRGRPFEADAVEDLLAAVDAAEGHALVVVEDAVRPDAAAVFDAVERLAGRDDVSFLLDARESEWADPPDGVDPGTEVEAVPLPRLDDAAVERVVAHFERTVGEPVPVDRFRDDLGRAGGEDAPGRMLLLLHRLATYADPLAEEETSLEAAVAALYDDLAGDDLALNVAVLANALNAAGLTVDHGLLYAVVDGDPRGDGDAGPADGVGPVDAAVDRLEGRVLFGRTDGRYRTVHEAWSTAFLDHLLEREGEAAAERFGDCVTRLLSLADDPDRREAIARHAEGWTPPRGPGAWADETAEALYTLGRERPKLAPLFGDGGPTGDTVALPDACSGRVAARRPVWLGRAFLAAGDYDRAERAFERLPPGDGDDGTAGADDLVVGRLLGLSQVADGRGDHVAAAGHARACLDRLDDGGVARGRAEQALGHARFARGDVDGAAANYRAALEAFEAAGDRRGRAAALNDLGAVAYRQGDYDRAREHFRESRDVRRELGDRKGEADTLDNLGLVARQQGDPDAARQYHERSLELERELGNRQGEAASLGNLGIVAHRQGDHEQAREYHERSLELERELGNRQGQATSLVSLGIVASLQGDYDRAREHFRESLELRRELDNPRGLAKSHTELGVVAYRQGDYDRARDHLEEGLELRRALDLPREVAVSLANLGQVACRQGDYDRARDHLEESLELRRKLDSRRGEASSRSHLGEVARRRGDHDAAREHLEASVETARAVGDDEVAARGRFCLGELARERGDHDAAREHLEAALAAGGSRFETAERRLALGRLALAAGDPGTAAERARAAREQFAEMGAAHHEALARRLLGRVAADGGDHAAARDHLEAALETFEAVGAAPDGLTTLEHLVDVADDDAAEAYRRRAREVAADAPGAAVDAHGTWLDELPDDHDG